MIQILLEIFALPNVIKYKNGNLLPSISYLCGKCNAPDSFLRAAGLDAAEKKKKTAYLVNAAGILFD